MTRDIKDVVNEPWSFAAKDIIETLPQVWTRGLLYFLVASVSVILPWSMLSKSDETGVAMGKLEPNGYTVKLDSQVSGTVSKVYVKEGSIVKNGQPILSIDSQLIESEIQQAQKKLEGLQKRLTELKSLRAQILLFLSTHGQENQSQELEKYSQVQQAQENLNILKNNYQFQISQKQSQLQQAQTLAQKSKKNERILKERWQNGLQQFERVKKFGAGVVSQDQIDQKSSIAMELQQMYEANQAEIIQNQQHVVELQNLYQQTIGQSKSDITLAQAKLNEQEHSYQTLKNSNQLALLKDQQQLKNTETDIVSLKSEIAQNETQISSLKIQLSQRMIKATTDGTIFQLPIRRAGAVLQPGTTIAEIAPKNSVLVLRALLPTDQNRFLKIGQVAKLKFDAYPYQDYGFISGKLLRISPTSTELETGKGKLNVYQIIIGLNQHCIRKANQCVALRAGDTATAEIVTGQRKIIDYVLDPFKRLSQDGLKL